MLIKKEDIQLPPSIQEKLDNLSVLTNNKISIHNKI